MPQTLNLGEGEVQALGVRTVLRGDLCSWAGEGRKLFSCGHIRGVTLLQPATLSQQCQHWGRQCTSFLAPQVSFVTANRTESLVPFGHEHCWAQPWSPLALRCSPIFLLVFLLFLLSPFLCSSLLRLATLTCC